MVERIPRVVDASNLDGLCKEMDVVRDAMHRRADEQKAFGPLLFRWHDQSLCVHYAIQQFDVLMRGRGIIWE